MPRLFIAVKLEKAHRERISNIQAELQKFDLPVRWVKTENIHLTLRFLGSVDDQVVPALAETLKTTAGKYRSCRLELKNLGAFPSVQRPRVIWVGASEKSGELARFHEDLEKGLARHGFEKDDRAFSPHITIGRVKSPKNTAPLKKYLADQGNITIGSQKIKEIVLFESTLTPQGSIYQIVKSFKLNKT